MSAGEKLLLREDRNQAMPPHMHFGTQSHRNKLILMGNQYGKICCLHSMTSSADRVLTIVYLGEMQQRKWSKEQKQGVLHVSFLT